MPKSSSGQKNTEKTPKGITVPVPRRADFFANLKKVAKVGKRSTTSGPKK